MKIQLHHMLHLFILKEVINHLVDQISPLVDENQPFQVDGKESSEASAIKSTCAVLENSLMKCNGKINEHILTVITALFLKLGNHTLSIYMLVLQPFFLI